VVQGSLRLRRVRWWRRAHPSDIALAIPAVLTLGVVTYAASVMAVPAGSTDGPPKLPPASVVASRPEQLRGPLNDPTSGPSAKDAQVIKESPRLSPDNSAGAFSLFGAGGNPALAGVAERLRSASQEGDPAKKSRNLPARDVQLAEDARAVQRRLAELGHFSGKTSGVWGPVSRAALRSFKEANELPQDTSWDAATEQALFRSDAPQAEAFVGRWAGDMKACSHKATKSGYLPTVIETRRARAGDASCSFTEKRQAGSTWRLVAQCTSGAERWTAHIEVAVVGDRLTWTSERGSQTYVRCQQPLELAGAGANTSVSARAPLR